MKKIIMSLMIMFCLSLIGTGAFILTGSAPVATTEEENVAEAQDTVKNTYKWTTSTGYSTPTAGSTYLNVYNTGHVWGSPNRPQLSLSSTLLYYGGNDTITATWTFTGDYRNQGTTLQMSVGNLSLPSGMMWYIGTSTPSSPQASGEVRVSPTGNYSFVTKQMWKITLQYYNTATATGFGSADYYYWVTKSGSVWYLLSGGKVLPATTLTGYTTSGQWRTSPTATSGGWSGGYDPNRTFSYTTNIPGPMLYLRVTPNVTSIALYNTATGTSSSTIYLRYDYGYSYNSSFTSMISQLSLPTRTGYKCTGYWSSQSGGTQYVNSSGSIIASDTLYPSSTSATWYTQWTPITTTITLDPNGGTGGSSSVTATYDSVLPSITVPSRTGYAFLGYATTSAVGLSTQYMVYNSSGTANANVSGYTNSAKGWRNTSSSLTLYARWGPKLCDITVNTNGGSVPNGVSGVSVTSVSTSGNHSFALNSQGFYESGAKGYSNSFSLARVSFTASANATISFVALKYTDASDYGYFGNLDANLASSSSYKTTLSNTTTLQTVTYTGISAGSHFIDVKYVKNGSLDYGYDSLQFAYNASPTNVKVLYGTKVFGTLPTITRTGYTFAGLTTTANGSTNVFNSSKASVSGISGYTDASGNWIATDAKTVYASWSPILTRFVVRSYLSYYGADYAQTVEDSLGNRVYGVTLSVKTKKHNNTTHGPVDATASSETGATGTPGLAGYSYTITISVMSGFHYMGLTQQTNSYSNTTQQTVYTNPNTTFSSAQTTLTGTLTSSQNLFVHVYVKKDREVNAAQGGRVTYGKLPQTYVGATLPGDAVNTGVKFGLGVNTSVADKKSETQTGTIWTYNGETYLNYNGGFYKFEPVVWRVNKNYTWTNGETKQNITIVSDKILGASCDLPYTMGDIGLEEFYGWIKNRTLPHSFAAMGDSNKNLIPYTEFVGGETGSIDIWGWAGPESPDKVVHEAKDKMPLLRTASISELNDALCDYTITSVEPALERIGNTSFKTKVVSGNTYSAFKVQRYEGSTYAGQDISTSTPGQIAYTFTKTSALTAIRAGFNGSTADACMRIDVSSFQNGQSYTIRFNLKNFTAGANGGEFEVIPADRSATYSDLAIAVLGSKKGLSIGPNETFAAFAKRVLNCGDQDYHSVTGDYWTRELGTYLGEGKIITNHGEVASLDVHETTGFRIAYSGSVSFFG